MVRNCVGTANGKGTKSDTLSAIRCGAYGLQGDVQEVRDLVDRIRNLATSLESTLGLVADERTHVGVNAPHAAASAIFVGQQITEIADYLDTRLEALATKGGDADAS